MAGRRRFRGDVWGSLLFIALCPLATAEETTIQQRLQALRGKYATAEAWAERRRELRTELLRTVGLWPFPQRPLVDAIVHSRREYGDYCIENVAIEILPGLFCEGNLYRPLGRRELSPIVLRPHGRGGPEERATAGQQICSAHFARMGATVFSYGVVDRQDPSGPGLRIWSGIRVLDYLASLPRIDAERIGIASAPGGGSQGLLLALVDDRVGASAPLVIVDPPAVWGDYPWEKEPSVAAASRADAVELAAAAAKNLLWLPSADETHDLGPAQRKLVYEFVAAHLPLEPESFLAPDKTKSAPLCVEDLRKVKIETPAQMETFNSAHPAPPRALFGRGVIAAAWEEHLRQLRQVSASRTGAVRIEQAPRAEYAFAPADADDEALLFTPVGSDKAGWPKVAAGSDRGRIEIVVRDAAGGEPTHCRVNVVGPDGDYYEPAAGTLKQYSLTGVWPQSGWGNRQGKAPIRYLGRFFYSDGTDVVATPAGTVRVEAWKGFEYRPATVTTQVAVGETRRVEIVLERTAPMDQHHYWSGDPHIHMERRDARDDERILDVLAAEDMRFGATLAYNEPAGRYAGFPQSLDCPQLRGLGAPSVVERGGYTVLSGQEYRSGPYGHLNLYLLRDLVAPGQSYNADHWPPFGLVAAKARAAGGVAFHAHGGYAQEIYADVAHGNIDGVELLQFGVYRGIGLEDWYHMLNAGFRVPATGACDYPACRKLADCATYVWSEERPSMEAWLRGMARGQSFFTSGPLLLLEVDGTRPGSQIDKSGAGPHVVTARVRVRCEVAPVTHVQLIANGRVLRQLATPRGAGQGAWLELEQAMELDRSAWIAARAYSLSSLGTPDAESHTNPVHVQVDGRPPYDERSLDRLVAGIDRQIAIQGKRAFAEQAQVLAYFEQARGILLGIRAAGGIAATKRR